MQSRSVRQAPKLFLADALNERLSPIAGIRSTINPDEIRGRAGY
jgi:hypothetical protein